MYMLSNSNKSPRTLFKSMWSVTTKLSKQLLDSTNKKKKIRYYTGIDQNDPLPDTGSLVYNYISFFFLMGITSK